VYASHYSDDFPAADVTAGRKSHLADAGVCADLRQNSLGGDDADAIDGCRSSPQMRTNSSRSPGMPGLKSRLRGTLLALIAVACECSVISNECRLVAYGTDDTKT
jgi:hypothetical protein